MSDDIETVTFTVTDQAGEESEVPLPAGLVDLFGENDETRADVVADVTLMAFVGRAHSLAHHSQDDVDAPVEAYESAALDLFEERFGVTYAEATGHSH